MKFLKYCVALFTAVLFLSACQGNSNVDMPTNNADGTPSEVLTENPMEVVEYSFFTSQDTFKIGDKIDIDVNINTNNADVLAGSIVLEYDDEILEIDKKSIVDAYSIFPMWIEKDVTDGIIKLAFSQIRPGVTTSESENVVTISAIAKENGRAELIFKSDSVVANNKHVQNIVNKGKLEPLLLNVKDSEE